VLKSETYKITVHEDEGWAAIEGPIGPFGKLLACFSSEFKLDGQGHLKAKRTYMPFFGIGITDRVIVMTALVPPIIAALRDAGFEPKVTHIGTLPEKFAADPNVMAELKEPWNAFAEAIDSNAEGLIEVSGTNSLIAALTAICRMYPTQQILVLAATHSNARWLRNQLWKHLRESVGLQIKQSSSYDRVVVATYSSMRKVDRFSMVITAFAHELGGCRPVEILAHIFKKVRRRYVFKLAHRPLDDPERVAARAFFGATIWSEKKETSIPVRALCFFTIGFGSIQSEDGLDFKRHSIWQNPGRNRFIAIVASALLAKNFKLLRALGLLSDKNAFPQQSEADRWRVAILVEGTEHAAAFNQLLPEWLVMRMGTEPTGEWSGTGAQGRIVTLPYAAKYGLDCHVLLRADGGDAIDFPGFPAVGSSIGILVDFADPGDDQRRLERRINNYGRRGWEIEYAAPKRNKQSLTILNAVAGNSGLLLVPENAVHTHAGSDCGRSPSWVAVTRSNTNSILTRISGPN